MNYISLACVGYRFIRSLARLDASPGFICRSNKPYYFTDELLKMCPAFSVAFPSLDKYSGGILRIRAFALDRCECPIWKFIPDLKRPPVHNGRCKRYNLYDQANLHQTVSTGRRNSWLVLLRLIFLTVGFSYKGGMNLHRVVLTIPCAVHPVQSDSIAR